MFVCGEYLGAFEARSRLVSRVALLERVATVDRYGVMGPEHDLTLKLRYTLARGLYLPADASHADVLEAMAMFQDVLQTRRRVFGPAHPYTRNDERNLRVVRNKLAEFDSRA